jgi:2'-5' RNA ligase
LAIRSFIAIPVPEGQAGVLHKVQHALEVGRPVAPEGWHVTLAFLGPQREAVLEEMHERLSGISVPGFDMRIAGTDIFGGRAPRVLHAGVERSDALVHLREKVRAAARAAGVELPRERFRPHVTLARFPKGLTMLETQRIAGVLEAYGDLDAGTIPVDHFALYRSHLGPRGPVYEPLAEYPLGTAGDAG